MLAAHGLTVPEGVECAAEDAVAAAARIGFPVTLKVSSDAIAHKTEAGGVVLDLADAEAVAEAAVRLSTLAPRLLVERMHKGAVAELIIGLTGDPQFGSALVIGAGGVLTELLADSATLLLPATRTEIETALSSLRVWRLVTGFRGRKGDADAVVQAIESIAAFALANEGLVEELDVNPLLVFPDGAVAVDALIRMRTP
ncbi:MAG: acetate--CoA ligase family protein [Alphaproteobacteria bacterium]